MAKCEPFAGAAFVNLWKPEGTTTILTVILNLGVCTSDAGYDISYIGFLTRSKLMLTARSTINIVYSEGLRRSGTRVVVIGYKVVKRSEYGFGIRSGYRRMRKHRQVHVGQMLRGTCWGLQFIRELQVLHFYQDFVD